MRLAGIMFDDVVDGIDDISVSVWMQGCPHMCEGCHNQSTWDPQGGFELDFNTVLSRVDNAIAKNGIIRNLSILGGEPLSPDNIGYSYSIAKHIKEKFPDSKVIVWTGYTLEELKKSNNLEFLSFFDYIIDGRFDKRLYDPSLKLRGSSNQRIYKRKKYKFIFFKNKIKFVDITDDEAFVDQTEKCVNSDTR